MRSDYASMRPARHQPLTGLLMLGLVLCMLAFSAFTAFAGSREYDIKAAYLYNFINYVEWPEQSLPPAGGSITIGVVGENPFGTALDPLKGKQVKGRTLVVKSVSTPEEIKACQIVFISSSEKQRYPKILENLKDAKVLTVSEIDGFAEGGGIVNFVYERNKVRFEINPDAAKSKGLTISSDLLKLARLVKS